MARDSRYQESIVRKIWFWLWYAVAAGLALAGDARSTFFWPITLVLVWIFVVLLAERLQRAVAQIPIPLAAKFYLLGLFFGAVVMENFAISFHGDEHSNLAINSFLWLGAYFGTLLGWWLLSRRWRFSATQVFFVAGLQGAFVEQNFALVKMLAKGQFLFAALTIPIILVVYAVAVAPGYVILEPELSRGRPRPNVAAWILAFLMPPILFFAFGGAWLKLFKPLLR